MLIQQFMILNKNTHSQRGFTLVELMVTVAVMAIIVSIAAPSMTQTMANKRIESTANAIASVLQQAKAEARIRNQEITVEYATQAVSAKMAGTSTVVDKQQINDRSQITASSTSINISPRGTTTATTYKVCDGAVSGETAIEVKISNTAHITRKKVGACS